MAGTKAPKGFGIAFAIVGVPLIVWSAMGTKRDLDTLDAAANTHEARIEQCVTNIAEFLPDTSIRRHVCGCFVAKAAARKAFERNGGYDEELLRPIIDECMRGD